jgi:hypothetical protein
VREHLVMATKIMIDPCQELILRTRVETRTDEVVGPCRVRKRLVLVNHVDRLRIQPLGRNDVARKWLPGQGISNGCESGKISPAHRFGQKVRLGDALSGLADTLVAAHEEGAVLPDWPADHASKLIAFQFRFRTGRRGKEIARIEPVAPHELGDGAMERVAAGPQLDVDAGASMPSILGGVVARLDVDLFNRVERREHGEDVVAVAGHRHAAEGNLLIPRSDAASLEFATPRDDARCQVSEVDEVAAGDRQVRDAFRGQHVPDHGALRLQQLTGGHDIDRFPDFTELDGEIYAHHLRDAKLDSGALGAEALEVDFDHVLTWREVTDLEGTVGAGHNRVGHAGCRVRDRHRYARDERSGRIGYGTENAGVNGLGRERSSAQSYEQQAADQPP